MLSISEIERILNCTLSEDKKNEILSLEETIPKKNYDLSGKSYQRLLVIGKGPTYISPGGTKQSQWWCICSCEEHNIILARTCNLNSGNTKSCNCLNLEKTAQRIAEVGRKAAIDITNKRYGKLIAIKPTAKRKGNSVVWECKCDCGNTHFVAANELNRGSTNSCGCLKESVSSFKIKNILKENNISFITEKTFPTCKFKDTKAYARFDFYLPDYNCLIEYDGEQHFKERDLNYFRDSLEKRQSHDNFKTQWCKDNNIKLIRFSYLEKDKITYEEIMKRIL